MLKQRTRMVVLSAAVLASGAAWSQGSASAAVGGSSRYGHGSGQVHETLGHQMQQMQSMQSTGAADRDFATMMRMHHQGAIDMAKAQLPNGKSPELKATARKIIHHQQNEIAQFDKWLAAHK